ncbi:hypothetical protein CEXT_267621 [Caerostris extrusa]|uniref:Uncharacterized protein n=1 Tax=Caerostris extrusa TaxID=172846 RepID=A0AAV4UL93_CAEEX|nr:hypothetical protein CEXT_267621 [Caerostris extrusa]
MLNHRNVTKHTHQSPPKLLVAGLPTPFTHPRTFTTEGCLYGCSVAENAPFPISFMSLICDQEQKEHIGKMKRDGKKRKVFINGTFRPCAPEPTSNQNKDPHWAKIESWSPGSVGPSKNVLD